MIDESGADLRTDIPHGARIWDYWLGGTHHFEADRTAADATARAFPQIVDIATESRRFLARSVRYLADDVGIDQFLDLGAGLPTSPSTHEIAQGVRSCSRVVYVDNDPLVLADGATLRDTVSADGVAVYIGADYHDPDHVLAEAATTLDLDRPVALMCMGVFGYLADPDQARGIMVRILERLVPGSHLILWDGTDTSEAVRAGAAAYAASGSSYHPRALGDLTDWFVGLELVEPGLVPLDRWRADLGSPRRPDHVDAWGGVARKP